MYTMCEDGADNGGGKPEIILTGTGTETAIAVEAAKKITGKRVR